MSSSPHPLYCRKSKIKVINPPLTSFYCILTERPNSIIINGVTELNMMKADVLSGLDTIKVCTHYILDGNKIDYLPFDDNEKLTPVYTELKGWEENLMKISSLDEAPREVHDYIEYLEKELEVPISIISVGPDRKQTFFR